MPKLIISLYVLTTSLALIVIKLSTKKGSPIEFINNRTNININYLTVIGIILYGVSFLTYIYLISKYDLGYIIPLTAAFIYIIIFVGSYFVFHEVFTVTKLVGIGLIIVGLAFLNFKK